MADSVNGGNGSPAPPKKEMSMEVRLLLAFVLMGVVLFGWSYIFPTPPVPDAKTAHTAETTQAKKPDAVQSPAPPPVEARAVKTVLAAGAMPQQPEPAMIIDTAVFRVVFSNQGGTLRSWQLKKHKGSDGKPLELMNVAAGMEYPFSLYFEGQQPAAKVNWTYYKQTADPDGLGVTFEYSDGQTSVKKVFRFLNDSHLCQVATDVTIDGKPVPHQIEWRGGFGDLTVPNPANAEHSLYFNLADNKLVEDTAKSVKGAPLAAAGNFSFAGLADLYFAAVFLPQGSEPMRVATFSDTTKTEFDAKPAAFTGVGVSDTSNRLKLFVGPKDVDLLKRVDPKLEQVVNFGWLAILAKPLFLIVNWTNDTLVHNFGWAIVIVTIIINFALFPLKMANMKSMRKMQALKPQIDAINAKYKNVGLRDPKKAEQNQEVMDLYKKYGVNPMGGCVPMALQIPFFFAFYKVFTVSVEMRGASWLWVGDLSQPEQLAIRILPIAMIASQFLMQRMTPQANADPSQQKMMMFMPLIFGFMFYGFPSGLVLYYLTSNLVSMGQQLFFNRTATAKDAAQSVELPKKKNGRK